MINKWTEIFKKWHFWLIVGVYSIYLMAEDFIQSESIEYFLTGFPGLHTGLAIGSFLIILIIYTVIWFITKLFTKKEKEINI